MTVMFRQEHVSGIGVLHCAPDDRFETALPTVIFLHNFGATKELVSYFGYLLAESGLRALFPEAPQHGARFDGDEPGRTSKFWEITHQYILEIEAIRAAYVDRGLILNPDRIGVAGTSMGAFSALGATAHYDWIGATAAYMGTAYFTDAARTIFPPFGSVTAVNREKHDAYLQALPVADPSSTVQRLARQPLFVWHGQRDDVVAFSDAVRLDVDLASQGARTFEVVIDPQGSHRVPDSAARRGVSFLKRWLAADAETDASPRMAQGKSAKPQQILNTMIRKGLSE